MGPNRNGSTIKAGNQKCQEKPAALISLTGLQFYPIVRSDSYSFISCLRLVESGDGVKNSGSFNIFMYKAGLVRNGRLINGRQWHHRRKKVNDRLRKRTKPGTAPCGYGRGRPSFSHRRCRERENEDVDVQGGPSHGKRSPTRADPPRHIYEQGCPVDAHTGGDPDRPGNRRTVGRDVSPLCPSYAPSACSPPELLEKFLNSG